MIERIEHTAIIVRDMEKSIQYYEFMLGFTLRKRGSNPKREMAFLQGPSNSGAEIELIRDLQEEQSYHSRSIVNHLAFRVADIEQAAESLRNKGVQFQSEDFNVTIDNGRSIFFTGINGELLQLVEPPTEKEKIDSIESRLLQAGITLDAPVASKANYLPIKQSGNLLYVSGTDCRAGDVLLYQGSVGEELSLEEGKAAARQAAINLLALLKSYLGDLHRVKQVVKLVGYVQSKSPFKQQPLVINGASELLIEVFGDAGRHARTALSAHSLPFDTPVEIELIVEVD